MTDVELAKALLPYLRDDSDLADVLGLISAWRPPEHRFDCDTCGKCVWVDEDGCCVLCGADANAVSPSK